MAKTFTLKYVIIVYLLYLERIRFPFQCFLCPSLQDACFHSRNLNNFVDIFTAICLEDGNCVYFPVKSFFIFQPEFEKGDDRWISIPRFSLKLNASQKNVTSHLVNSGFCNCCGIKTVVFVRLLPLEAKWLHCMWGRIVFGTLCPHCTPWSVSAI